MSAPSFRIRASQLCADQRPTLQRPAGLMSSVYRTHRDGQQNLVRLHRTDSSHRHRRACPSPRRVIEHSGLKSRMPADQRCLHAVDDPGPFALARAWSAPSRIGIATISQCGLAQPSQKHADEHLLWQEQGHQVATPYAFADAAYAFERIASAKVTIRPRPSSHSAWRDARNPSVRVSTDATVKPGCAPWQASSR